MKTKTGKTLIPRLRFPEFQNNGEWEVKRIGEFLTESKIPSYTNDPRKRITVRLNYGGVEKREYRGTEAVDASNYFIRKKGQFIYGKQNFHKGAFGIIPDGLDGFESSQDLPAFDFAQFINPIFFINTLLRNEFYKAFETYTIGTGSKRLHPSELFKVKIPLPSLPEQQKIADCLSSLDEVIAGERQKLELLKAHKKGLLQNLFPQEGETVPKLRFPEFKDSGEWVEKKLGEIYEFKITNSFSRDMLNYEFGEIKNIHYGDIHTKFNTLFDIKKEIVPFINPDVCIDKIKEDSYCKEGDIIFADASEDLNDVGKSIEIFNLNGEKLVSGLHTLLARQKENFFIVGFAGFLFKSDWIRKQIQKEAQGAKVLGISTSRISNINIKFPKSKKEQQKIASCLSSLDDVIQAQQQKIELLEQHKKGLLQGLFPNVNDGDNG
jgi:type I restriction enzyme S subunit